MCIMIIHTKANTVHTMIIMTDVKLIIKELFFLHHIGIMPDATVLQKMCINEKLTKQEALHIARMATDGNAGLDTLMIEDFVDYLNDRYELSIQYNEVI